jgi:hypothetical protein
LSQGCSILLLLLLLVAKGLSEILKSLKEGGRLNVIQVTKELTITHLLFVYDVLLFGNGSSRE